MKKFIVTRETIAACTIYGENNVAKSIGYKELVEDDLASIAIWLSEHGTPHIRAAMARRLTPVVLGLVGRTTTESDRLMGMIEGEDLLLQMFKTHTKPRVAKSKKLSKLLTGKPGRHAKKES